VWERALADMGIMNVNDAPDYWNDNERAALAVFLNRRNRPD
jgi:hypothetical protein